MDQPANLLQHLREHPYLRQWLIIGLVLALFAGIVAYDLMHERRALQENTEERLQSSARMVDDNLSSQLEIAGTMLADIVRDIPAWQQESTGSSGAKRRLTAMARALPGVRSFSIINVHGLVIASNLSELIDRDLSGRSYFSTARRHNDIRILHVSEPFVAVTGNFVITLTRSYTDSNGDFAGAVVASLDAGYFTTLMKSVLHAPDMRSAVIHEDGQPFVMVPPNNQDLALPTHDALFLEHKRSGRSTTLQTGHSSISGDERIMVLHTVRPAQLNMDKGLVIAISRNRATVLAEWYELAFMLGGAVLCVFMLSIGLQRFHQRSQEMHEEEARRAEQAAQAAEQRFATAFNEAPIGMLLRYPDDGVIQVNRALCNMLGYSAEEIARLGLPSVMSADDKAREHALIHELMTGSRRDYQMRLPLKHREGHTVWVQLSVSGVFDNSGKLEYLIKQMQDITLQHEQSIALENLAHYDVLTHLPNRALLDDRLRQSIAQAKRNGSILAVGFLDLDDFKPINDRYGHDAGDEVLVITAARMLECIRAEDTLARLGGDEFVFILGSVSDEAECEQVIARLRGAIEKPIVLGNGAEVRVSASFGFSFYPQDSDSPDTLLRYADRAMYIAKYSRSGQHRFSGMPSAVPRLGNFKSLQGNA